MEEPEVLPVEETPEETDARLIQEESMVESDVPLEEEE